MGLYDVSFRRFFLSLGMRTILPNMGYLVLSKYGVFGSG